MLPSMEFNPVFIEDSKMGSAIFVPFVSWKLLQKKQKNTTFARFSDYYLNIPLWGHSFLTSLYWDIYSFNCLPLEYPSDIYV